MEKVKTKMESKPQEVIRGKTEKTEGELKFLKIQKMKKEGMSVNEASNKLGVSSSFYYYYKDKNKKKKQDAKKEKERIGTVNKLAPMTDKSVSASTAALVPLSSIPPQIRNHNAMLLNVGKKEHKVIMVVGPAEAVIELAAKLNSLL